jgi:predicted transcriptional regulator
MAITATQCRMARAALRIGVLELAAMAKVATGTITRLEAGDELKPRTLEAIQTAFEKAGVEFTNGDAPGVRLKRR